MANELSIYRGDTFSATVTVTDDEGAIFDLTSYTMKLTVKRNSQDTDAQALIGPITATISTPATGVGIIAISAAQSAVDIGEYVYDIQINNSTTDVKTIVKSSFTVLDDVTKA